MLLFVRIVLYLLPSYVPITSYLLSATLFLPKKSIRTTKSCQNNIFSCLHLLGMLFSVIVVSHTFVEKRSVFCPMIRCFGCPCTYSNRKCMAQNKTKYRGGHLNWQAEQAESEKQPRDPYRCFNRVLKHLLVNYIYSLVELWIHLVAVDFIYVVSE